MNGIHDMGGMDGFGAVVAEPDEPVFHEPWEGRVLAISRAMSSVGAWNGSMSRFAQEQLPPAVYLGASYYERRVLAMQDSLVRRDLAGADELAAGHALRPGKALKPKLTETTVERVFTRGASARPATAGARFAVDERVRAKVMHPATHTRLPRYVRGQVGVVERVLGCHAFPDDEALGIDEHPQWLYTVTFGAATLWGADADPTLTVSVDAFEPYLEAVG